MGSFAFRLALSALVGVCVAWTSGAAAGAKLISQPAAKRHGLTRAWFTQISIDRGRSRITGAVLNDDVLFVQTDRATVHALNAETGQALWDEQVGNPDHSTLTAGVDGELVAVVNGATLYVLNRYNGNLLWQTRFNGAPGAGAAVSGNRIYVPMVQGMVHAYLMNPVQGLPEEPIETIAKIERKELTPEEKAAEEAHRRASLRLEQEDMQELSCQSFGGILVQPTVIPIDEARDRLAWPNDRGSIFVSEIDLTKQTRFLIDYQIAANSEIVGQIAYVAPDPKLAGISGLLLFASNDGHVTALRQESGELLWHFSSGEAIGNPVAVVGARVYVATQLAGMYCLNAATGEEHWQAPGIRQFVAASKDRLYAVDGVGRIQVLDASSGARVDVLDLASIPIKLTNTTSDRIYLMTDGGLVQCLHEVELSEPLRHAGALVPKQGETEAKTREAVEGSPPAEPRKGPDSDEQAPPDSEVDPFDDEAPSDDENPVG